VEADETSPACSPSIGSPPPTQGEPTAWDSAAHFTRLSTMDNAKGQSLYEDRLATWGRACILCSFERRQRVPSPHPDCMQTAFSDSLTQFRRSIRFDNGVGCFRCGQMMFICQQRGQAGCRFPWFIFHCCWVAVHRDYQLSSDLIKTLGGPDLSLHAVGETHPAYLQWLGRRCLLFGRMAGSNAVRLSYFWIDRLESLCL